jgi:cysteine desulfurase
LPVDETGLVNLAQLEASFTDETSMVSIMAANNEIGTIQPIAAIGALCSSRGVLFHTDLAQVIAYGEVDVLRDNIHLASMSAHKAYGPKGVGALYIRSRNPRAKVTPLMFGGGQERRLRPGTLNTPYIVGMGEAFSIAKNTAFGESKRLRELCNVFRDSFLGRIPYSHFNGHPTERLANNLSFSVDGVEPLALIRALRGQISFSASSACSTDKIETSSVLLAMFGETERARAAFRIAPGRFTTSDEMELALELIVAQIVQLNM